jgi:hypothetical protein
VTIDPAIVPAVAATIGAVAAVRKMVPKLDGPRVLLLVLAAAGLVALAMLPWTGPMLYAQHVAAITLVSIGGAEMTKRAGGRGR